MTVRIAGDLAQEQPPVVPLVDVVTARRIAAIEVARTQQRGAA